jgi:hypothetical protein
MRRAVGLLIVLVAAASCQTPESAVQPLPPNAQPLSYQELLNRTKAQVAAAQEFFYRDSWREVEQAALSLQQSAELLGKVKPEDLPLRQRDQSAKLAKQIQEAAVALGESARAHDVLKTTQAFQSLNLTIREMRAE